MLDPIGFLIAIIVAIVGYRYAAKKQQSRTLDGNAIKKLEESGLDITQEHQLEFWFYSDEKSSVMNLVDELENRKFQVHLSETEQDPKFVIRALKSMVPELAELQGLRKEFNCLSKEHRSQYDGWGCSVGNYFNT